MRIPFIPDVIGKVGGGLILTQRKTRFSVSLDTPSAFVAPNALDNSGYCTPLESQGNNPWCDSYATCQMLQASYWRDFGVQMQFDEAKHYRECKIIDGDTNEGTSLETGLKVAETIALNDKGIIPVIQAKEIEDDKDIPYAIHKYGMVLTGLRITDGWQYTRWNGMIGDGKKDLGGHAVLSSAYSFSDDFVKGPNWWGVKWGRKGFWKMTRKQFHDQFIYGYAVQIIWP